MTRRRHEQLAQLAIIARMLHEKDQAKLQTAAQFKQRTEDKLEVLNQSLVETQAWESVASAQAALIYETWADCQRRDLNIELAQQTALWMDARRSSCSSFGRKLAVGNLLKSKP